MTKVKIGDKIKVIHDKWRNYPSGTILTVTNLHKEDRYGDIEIENIGITSLDKHTRIEVKEHSHMCYLNGKDVELYNVERKNGIWA